MNYLNDYIADYARVPSNEDLPNTQMLSDIFNTESVTENMVHVKLKFRQFTSALRRKKEISSTVLSESKLIRCLSTLDLTALGIGSTLGVGVYVLAGEVSKTTAGPAVIISFLIAAIASIFAGLCYAEFGARVPKAGSAYVYSYVCVGEFIAFIIGWNLLLEYIIGSASVVKGLSTYTDALIGKRMGTYLNDTIPMNVDYLADYPDVFAFFVTILFSTALAFGAKESSLFNNIFTLVNLCVVIFVIVAGVFKAHPSNWTLKKSTIPDGYGKGGFAPYGISGIVKGAAKCFYGFIGFDCVATAGEEAQSPQRSIPIAVVSSLLVVFLAYCGVSTVLTMMLPYYLQDTDAPLPHVFDSVGWTIPKYIVSVGAMAGLCSSLLGALYPLPRIIYAMSSDGLLFQFMGKIHPKFNTPLYGTLAAGVFTGILAALLDLDRLVSMMSIGTLLAYSMVASCVLILRYEEGKSDKKDEDSRDLTLINVFKQMFNTKLKNPTSLTARLVMIQVVAYVLWCIGFTSTIVFCEKQLQNRESWAIGMLVVFGILLCVTLMSIQTQPTSNVKLTFSVPLVPWLPGISILINIYLMLQLSPLTWIQFTIWIFIGLIIYFCYGIFNSNERYTNIASISSKNCLVNNEKSRKISYQDIKLNEANYVPKIAQFS
ncbi:cationic amino acid transporter 2-like [Chrysoperla carnea]|uniref:cationic amino acid transporter 2-like n=1 Tax=Chrysoperla carnea TaxID=189513 RepID=UPI001D064DAA|nr:cationic amino acid transporter 2-like [Chrysoperla carnea]